MKTRKFRGKTLDTNEWAYGYYFYDDIHKKHFILSMDVIGNIRETQVDPETVGQYTGLKNKTGKNIYEGDITAINYLHRFPAKVFWNTENASFEMESQDNISAIYDHYEGVLDIEVIGNIHDNPELVK